MLNIIDFLSPSITLFYFEKRSHTSRVGGSLVVLMVSLSLSYAIYIFYITLCSKKVTTIFYKKFQWEAGYYSLNSSSIFNFFQIYSKENGGYFNNYDSHYIHSYITYAHPDFKENELGKNDHWVFDKCQNLLNNNSLNNSLLSNIDNFNNSACISYYYNSFENKYFSIEEKGFIWPHLEHGTSRKDNIYLSATIQKCTNNSIINSLFGNCHSKEEIDEYINKYNLIYIYFTDMQINPLDYNNPIKRYLNNISSGIGNNNTFVENYIHFSPLKVITNEGEVISKTYENNSFYFDSNIKNFAKNSEEYFKLAKYYYLMQNNFQIYERRYNNFFDIIAQIGGEVQFLYYLFFSINFIYNRFIIASDTNKLFFHVKETKNNITHIEKIKEFSSKFSNDEKNKIKNMSNKNIIQILNFENNSHSEENSSSQKNNLLKSKANNVFPNQKDTSSVSYNLNKINKNKISLNGILTPRKEQIDKSNSNIFLKDNSNNEQSQIFNNNKLNIIPKALPKNSVFSVFENKQDICGSPQYKAMKKFRISKRSVQRIDHQKTICENLIKEERMKLIKNLTFVIFIKSLCISKYKGSTDFITSFRKNLLSEEHFFKSHIKNSLLEKQYKLNQTQNISFIDCFNNL